METVPEIVTTDKGLPYTFVDILRMETAAMQAVKPQKTGEIGRAHAAIINGHVIDAGGGWGKVRSDSSERWYQVNGVCECEAAAHGHPCKHLATWKFYQHVQKKWEAQARTPAGGGETAPEPEDGRPRVPHRFIKRIHGKDFIRYAGLLWLAHQRGLQSLSATYGSVTATLAVAQATAVFSDGTSWTEAGEATPDNVNVQVKPHFARCALTRAKARCLRDALNLGDMCAVEELDAEEAA